MLWMLCKPIERAGLPMLPATGTDRALPDSVQIMLRRCNASKEAGIACLTKLPTSIAALELAAQGPVRGCGQCW